MNTFDIVNLKPSWFGISFLSHLIFHVKMKKIFFMLGGTKEKNYQKNRLRVTFIRTGKKSGIISNGNFQHFRDFCR